MLESHTQYPQKINVWAGILKKINVWAGILNDTLIGPFFIDGNLNARAYEELLRNKIVRRIMEITGDNFQNIWFQQDRAAAHYDKEVRVYLDTQFPHRWIGRRGEIEWPARSPDLTPLDYFLWGYFKSKVYSTQPQSLDEPGTLQLTYDLGTYLNVVFFALSIANVKKGGFHLKKQI